MKGCSEFPEGYRVRQKTTKKSRKLQRLKWSEHSNQKKYSSLQCIDNNQIGTIWLLSFQILNLRITIFVVTEFFPAMGWISTTVVLTIDNPQRNVDMPLKKKNPNQTEFSSRKNFNFLGGSKKNFELFFAEKLNSFWVMEIWNWVHHHHHQGCWQQRFPWLSLTVFPYWPSSREKTSRLQPVSTQSWWM